jgi:hypothetical protein
MLSENYIVCLCPSGPHAPADRNVDTKRLIDRYAAVEAVRLLTKGSALTKGVRSMGPHGLSGCHPLDPYQPSPSSGWSDAPWMNDAPCMSRWRPDSLSSIYHRWHLNSIYYNLIHITK